jgi:hypothetical protein
MRNSTRRVLDLDEDDTKQYTESQKRLQRAIELIYNEFAPYTEDYRSRFARWLFDEVSIVKVRVTEHNIGYKVFLVLNQRGKPLSDHDILKSALFERSGFTPDEANRHSAQWNTFASQLGAKNFEGMLKQIRTLYDRNGRGEFIDGLIGAIIPRLSVGQFINEMLPRFVAAYDCIMSGKDDKIDIGPEARRSLVHLRAIAHEGWRAPAIRFLTDYDFDHDSAGKFFASLERLVFWLQYCVRDRDKRLRRYRQLLDFMDLPLEEQSAVPSPLDLSREEKQEIIDRLRGRFTSYKQRRMLLMRVSAAVPGGVPLPPETDSTVEHILPKTPSKGSDWYEEWSRAKDREDLTECIGNYTLLTHDENQAADRKAFVQKLNIYFRNNGQASFAISNDLKGRTRWTPEDVRARREMLIGHMAKEWGIEMK